MTQPHEHLFAEYLWSPSDSHAITQLCSHGEAAVDAVIHYKGPIPESMHPRDVYDTHLTELLQKIIQLRPELLLHRNLNSMESRERYRLLVAAACTRDERFTEVILNGLKDRSVYVKLMVVSYMEQYQHLRKPDTVPLLKRLLTQKTMHDDDRKHIDKLLKLIEGED